MLAPNLHGLVWRTSSFSGSGGASSGCVEVAPLPEGGMAVRDTKDRSRPAHRHTARAWQAFLTGIRAGEFTDRTK
jgi:uncharacterized protein DUF397